jgi:hypothetical protein
MAVNVDIVYKTVLLILNKEQRGNLSPDEFNKVATQVQLEIFEGYFDSLNQQLRVPDNNSEYADRVKNINENIATFKAIGPATYSGNATGHFNLPITSGESTAIQTFTGDSATISFPFTSITPSQLAGGTTLVTINGISTTGYSISGANIIFNVAPATGAAIIVTVTPSDFYRLGSVIYKDTKEVQLSQRSELLYINSSPLIKPTTTYPIYLFENNRIYIYPTTIKSDITVSYIRKPQDVSWNFTVPLGQNFYQYSSIASVNFQLNKNEQSNIILKILLYSGVVIRDPQIINVAAQQIQQEQIQGTL